MHIFLVQKLKCFLRYKISQNTFIRHSNNFNAERTNWGILNCFNALVPLRKWNQLNYFHFQSASERDIATRICERNFTMVPNSCLLIVNQKCNKYSLKYAQFFIQKLDSVRKQIINKTNKFERICVTKNNASEIH